MIPPYISKYRVSNAIGWKILTFHQFAVRNLTPRARPGLWQVSEALHLCTPGEGKWAKQYLSWNYFRSMYFDEDGDLAHEFYEEVLPRYKNVMLQPRMSVVYRNIYYIIIWKYRDNAIIGIYRVFSCPVSTLSLTQSQWLTVTHSLTQGTFTFGITESL